MPSATLLKRPICFGPVNSPFDAISVLNEIRTDRVTQHQLPKKGNRKRTFVPPFHPEVLMRWRELDPLTKGHEAKLTYLSRDWLFWLAESGRDLPWRAPTTSALERIRVEILLQRKRAAIVIGIYHASFDRFWALVSNRSCSNRQVR